MLPILREHHNSLNVNFSLSCVETLTEAFRIFNGVMTDEEPYLIINTSGLSIEIKDSHKDNSLPQEVPPSHRTTWQGWKEVYRMKKSKSSQQKQLDTKALINLAILNYQPAIQPAVAATNATTSAYQPNIISSINA